MRTNIQVKKKIHIYKRIKPTKVWTVRSSTTTRMWTYVSVCSAKLLKPVVFLIGYHITQIYTWNIISNKQISSLKSGVIFKDFDITIYTKNPNVHHNTHPTYICEWDWVFQRFYIYYHAITIFIMKLNCLKLVLGTSAKPGAIHSATKW